MNEEWQPADLTKSILSIRSSLGIIQSSLNMLLEQETGKLEALKEIMIAQHPELADED